jgi:hypothetical protein
MNKAYFFPKNPIFLDGVYKMAKLDLIEDE